MIARLALAALALALALAAPASASAAPLPTLGAADGVTMTVADGTVTARFAGASVTAAAAYVGRTVVVECEPEPMPGLIFRAAAAFSSAAAEGTLSQAADGTLTVSGRFDPAASGATHFDVCAIPRAPQPKTTGRRGPFRLVTGAERPPLARVALTPAGTTWIEELGHVAAMLAPLARFAGATHDPLPAAVAGPGIVALDSPDATPPAGQAGYWSDGAFQLAVVTTSDAGRRLVYEQLAGEMTRSNIGQFTGAVSALTDNPEYELDTRGTDRDAKRLTGHRPKVVTAAGGVHAAVAGTRLTLRFGGASATALRAVAGRRVSVTCSGRREHALTGPDPIAGAFQLVVVRVPRHGTVLRARLKAAGAADVCLVSDDGAPVAIVTPTAAGRALVQDITAAAPLYGVELAPKDATAYPPAATIAAQHPGTLVALPGPGAFPPKGRRLGIWTAGDRAVIAATSASGHHFVLADEGNGVLRSNLDALLLRTALLGSFG